MINPILIEFYLKELINYLVNIRFYIANPEFLCQLGKLDTFYFIHVSCTKVTCGSYFPLV